MLVMLVLASQPVAPDIGASFLRQPVVNAEWMWGGTPLLASSAHALPQLAWAASVGA